MNTKNFHLVDKQFAPTGVYQKLPTNGSILLRVTVRMSGNLRFDKSKRGEQNSHKQCSLVLSYWMITGSGNLRFEVSKRGEQKCDEECWFVM